MSDAWEMRWETRHSNAVKDYEQKKEGKVQMIDLTEKLDRLEREARQD